MIDLHCHILPNIDDGPLSVEESIQMARKARSDGIKAIVATPHVMNGNSNAGKEEILQKVAWFNEELPKHGIDLTIYPGSEIYFNAGLSDQILAGNVLSINDTGKFYLIEFPFHFLPDGFQTDFFNLQMHHITPIIAHPERNFVFQQRFELFYDLINMGCLLQINAMSITGGFGEEAMMCAHKLIQSRLAHIIASDAHSRDSRPPILSKAIHIAKQLVGKIQDIYSLVEENPRRILEN